MSIELSPSQERRLHSILDRGLEALQDSRGSPDTTGMLKLESNFLTSNSDSPKKSSQKLAERSVEADELKMLRDRLAILEAKVSKTSEPGSQVSSKRKSYSPGPSIRQTTSSRSSSIRDRSIPRNESRDRSVHRNDLRDRSVHRNESRDSSKARNESRNRVRSIENSEKEIVRLERNITPSPARRKNLSNSRQIEKVRILVEKERKLGEKLRKENESLRKELGKREELRDMVSKLQDEYNELAQSFERSEAVRKKQKELIQQLKEEIQAMNGGFGEVTKGKKKKRGN